VHGGAVIITATRTPARSWFALALALLVHAALLFGALRPALKPPQGPVRATLWVNVAPPLRKPVTPPLVQAPTQPRVPTPRQRARDMPAAPALAAPTPAVAVREQEAPVPAAPPAISVEQMMSIAKRDLGKIDKDLRKENRQQFSAPVDSRQLRLERGIEQAHEAAPNKWYQAAKVEDITPPGDDARKIYRITSALGTYCVRYPDKNRADQGKANAGEPLIGACPHMIKGL
jgi:hypothetical protein